MATKETVAIHPESPLGLLAEEVVIDRPLYSEAEVIDTLHVQGGEITADLGGGNERIAVEVPR